MARVQSTGPSVKRSLIDFWSQLFPDVSHTKCRLSLETLFRFADEYCIHPFNASTDGLNSIILTSANFSAIQSAFYGQ
jgi:hypothetical protein